MSRKKKKLSRKRTTLGLMIGLGGKMRADAKLAIQGALDECEGDHTKAALELGVGRASLYRYMEAVGIETRRSS